MKVLFTTFTFAPEGNGVAEVVTAQAHGLAARGHDVTVATAFVESAQPREPSKLRIIEFPVCYEGQTVVMEPQELRRYRDLVAAPDWDAIVSHCWGAWSTDFALDVLACHAAAKVFVSHGYAAHKWHPHPRFPWGIPSWVRGLPYLLTTIKALGIFDHIVFLSSRVDWDRYFDRRLVQWLRRPPWSVIPNGTYPEKSREAGEVFRRELGIDGFLIFHVGGYYDRKNQPLALRAFLKAGLERATLVFIGNEFNDYSDDLRRLNQQLNPDPDRLRVIFLEKQSRERIRAAYLAADLFILPSKRETQPMVILEAMAAGTPFLSTDVGCVSELPGGLIARDERHMSLLLFELAGNGALRAQLARAGFEAASTRYSWSRVIGEYEQLLLRLTSGAAPPNQRRHRQR
jgi:glycosyltransferase involved in cell wall biosynthesis